MKNIIKKTTAVLMCSLIAAGTFIVPYKTPFLSPTVSYAITSEQEQFIENIGNAAQKNYNKYKILPSMTTAQAILESGWGTSSLSKLYYNFFGMKAGSSYTGETVTLKTGEEVNGVKITVNGTFRVYHSFEEGIEGYYQFITGMSRYSNLIGETNYATACTKIKEDGWATDSQYSSKLISLIEKYNLTRFDTVDPYLDSNQEYFPKCASSYTSLVDALNSIGVDSSKEYRAKIAAANGISNYSYSADQNYRMLELLKAGNLVKPDYIVTTTTTQPIIITTTQPIQPNTVKIPVYYPKCASNYTSIVDALNSIGVDSSKSNRANIAATNGISNYSYSAEQNSYMLELLKAGSLVNYYYDETVTSSITTTQPVQSNTVKIPVYYPKCASNYTSIVDALNSIGVDSSKSNRANIAATNGISNYSYSAEQNGYMLELLKAGSLVNYYYDEIVVVTVLTTTTTAKLTTTTTTTTTTKATTTTAKPITTTITTTSTTSTTTTTTSAITASVTTKEAKTPVILPSELTLQTGDTSGLIVLNCDNTDNILWKSNNNKVAEVENGVVTALSEGNATIYAIVNNVFCEVSVTVEKAEEIILGDANCDGEVNMADAVSVMQYIANPDRYSLSKVGFRNADVSGNNDGVTNSDALYIQMMCLQII